MKRFFILKKKFVFNSPTLDELCISLKTAEKMRGALPKLAFDEGISIRCSEKMSYNTYKRRKCKHEKIILKHITVFSFWDLLFDIHYSKTSPYMIFWQEKIMLAKNHDICGFYVTTLHSLTTPTYLHPGWGDPSCLAILYYTSFTLQP